MFWKQLKGFAQVFYSNLSFNQEILENRLQIYLELLFYDETSRLQHSCRGTGIKICKDVFFYHSPCEILDRYWIQLPTLTWKWQVWNHIAAVWFPHHKGNFQLCTGKGLAHLHHINLFSHAWLSFTEVDMPYCEWAGGRLRLDSNIWKRK